MAFEKNNNKTLLRKTGFYMKNAEEKNAAIDVISKYKDSLKKYDCVIKQEVSNNDNEIKMNLVFKINI